MAARGARRVLAALVATGAFADCGSKGWSGRLSAFCHSALGASWSCRLEPGLVAGASAWGEYEDTVDSKGFALLRVSGAPKADPEEMAFAAGVVEGALTAGRISQHVNNSVAAELADDPELRVVATDFLTQNDAYVRHHVAAHANSSAYWRQVGLIWVQLDGLLEGHRLALEQMHAKAVPLSRTDLLFINALVDLSSVIHKPFAGARDPRDWTPGERAAAARRTHCSAIVKVTPDYSELWTAHNTWTDFCSMLRVAKLYDLPLPGAAASRAAFPGYFGTLSSNDDLFVLSSGLAVQETTNTVFPPQSRLHTPSSVLTWARTVVANRMATDGQSWTQWFAKENSGTINNQWMVVDYNKFVPRKPLPNGTLWVLEQLPGYVESADLTSYLRQGHWPSYNQPFFPEVRRLSGNDAMAERFGMQYTYELNPRAKLFRRDASRVQSREELKRFMRYNDWRHDPLSAAGYGGPDEPRSPENAIASRADLIPKNATVPEQAAHRAAFGNTDAKVVGRADVLAMRFEFVVGPTHDDQPPFRWAGDWAEKPHEGQPIEFDFPWHSAEFSGLDAAVPDCVHPEAVVV